MKQKKIFIAGDSGLIGSTIKKKLKNRYKIYESKRINFENQNHVLDLFVKERFDEVYLTAGLVGGINANINRQAEFLYKNLIIACNIIDASFKTNVNKLLNIGCACMYPRMSEQPIKESQMLSGPLEPTNESYALAKIAGMKLCSSYNHQFKTDYRTIIPSNVYGPGDNFDLNTGHVIPSLIRRFHIAKIKDEKKITIWGTGKAQRNFIYVDDVADACVFFMELNKKKFYDKKLNKSEYLNVGSKQLISISELSELIKGVTEFRGIVDFDTSKPDGMPIKYLDTGTCKKFDFLPQTSLYEGIKKTYSFFLDQYEKNSNYNQENQ